jgi:hypothetical protein
MEEKRYMGIEVIEHKGKKILYVDYSPCKTKEETIALLEKAAEEFKKSTCQLLTLDNYEKQFASQEFMTRAKELSSVFSPKRKKGAAIGVKGLKKMLLQAYNLFAKDKIIPFDTKEEALDYLVKD